MINKKGLKILSFILLVFLGSAFLNNLKAKDLKTTESERETLIKNEIKKILPLLPPIEISVTERNKIVDLLVELKKERGLSPDALKIYHFTILEELTDKNLTEAQRKTMAWPSSLLPTLPKEEIKKLWAVLSKELAIPPLAKIPNQKETIQFFSRQDKGALKNLCPAGYRQASASDNALKKLMSGDTDTQKWFKIILNEDRCFVCDEIVFIPPAKTLIPEEVKRFFEENQGALQALLKKPDEPTCPSASQAPEIKKKVEEVKEIIEKTKEK